MEIVNFSDSQVDSALMSSGLSRADSSPSTSVRSRKAALALIIIGSVACIGALLMFGGAAGNQSEFIVNLAYNEKDRTQIISSNRQMSICSDQVDHQQGSLRNICSLYTTTQDLVITRTSQDTVTIYVVYNSITESKTDSSSTRFESVDDMINDPINGYDGQVDEYLLTFKAVVSTSGVFLSLDSPNGPQPDTLVRLTERLIQQHFPEIDPKLYQSPYMLRQNSPRTHRRRLLGSTDSLPTQETFLGEVVAEYTYHVEDSGETILKKEYTDDDFVTYDYNLGGDLPDIKYLSKTIVNPSGVVAQNIESMHFNMTDPLMNDPTDEFDELIGFVSVRVDSVMEITDVRDKDDALFEMINAYESANAFVTVDLDSDGGFISVNHQQEQQEIHEINPMDAESLLLGASVPQLAYKKDVSVFRKSVLAQTIEMKIVQSNYEVYSDFDIAVYLNDRKLVDIVSGRINHPWLACQSEKSGSGTTFDKDYKLFEVQFPILGIITIPIRASIRVNYGWAFTMSPAAEVCNVQFTTYAKPSIAADGGLSILKIAEGGVSFSGSVANGYFNFNVAVNRSAFSAILDINAQFIPFEYSIDAYYRYFRCDFKSIFNRNLFFKKIIKKVVNVVQTVVKVAQKIIHVCGLSDPHFLNISKGQLGHTYTLAIYKQGFLLKNRS